MSVMWCLGDGNWKYSICIKRRKRRGIICEAAEEADIEKGVVWGRLSNCLQPETWLKSPRQDNLKRCFPVLGVVSKKKQGWKGHPVKPAAPNYITLNIITITTRVSGCSPS